MARGVFQKCKKSEDEVFFAVNAIKKSLLLFWPERAEYSTKQQVETLPKPCATILISHNPICIQACWI